MREHLKFALSYWHTIDAEGVDMFGSGTMDKSMGQTDPMAKFRAKADFAFELMEKLNIDYYCFHDVDIAPEWRYPGREHRQLPRDGGLSVRAAEEDRQEVPVGNGQQLRRQEVYGRCSHLLLRRCVCRRRRQSPGLPGRRGEARRHRLCILGRPRGATTPLLNTDMGLELDNMARFLRMARDYGRKIGFTGDFYLEPKPKEPTKHQYDFDVATCMNFLRKYDLTADFKMNIEANHATLAGHTFEHELRTAIVNGSFGSIDANEGDYLLGWDTDQFPANVYSATYCMMEVLRAGGFTNGGLNFDAKARRQSNTFEDILLAYISGMDTFALGLRKALELKADGRLDQFVKERYSSYDSGVGKKIVDGEMTLESLADYAEGLKNFDVPSGRQEYLESVVNRVLFH